MIYINNILTEKQTGKQRYMQTDRAVVFD